MTHIDDLIELLCELKNQDLPNDIKILIYSSVNDYRLKLEKLIASMSPTDSYSESTKDYINLKNKELNEHYEMVISLIPAMLYYLVQKNK
jgi:hypothetical protein